MLEPPVTLPNQFIRGALIASAAMNDNFAALLGPLNNTRTVMTAPLTFYVAPGGHDGGIPTSSTQPAATVNYVLQLIQQNYDLQVHTVTIQLADGVYNESIWVSGKIIGQSTPAQLVIQGNMVNPDNVTISGNPPFAFANHCDVKIQGMKLTGTNVCLLVRNFANVNIGHIDFGAAGNYHIYVRDHGLLMVSDDYTISAGSGAHWFASTLGAIEGAILTYDGSPIVPAGPTITLLGSPTFGTAFATASHGQIRSLATFVGGAIGPRYNASMNGVIFNGGRNDLPGNAPGVIATGGQYS